MWSGPVALGCVFVCFLDSCQFVLQLVYCVVSLVAVSFAVSTGALDCLDRLVSEMTCYVSSGTFTSVHLLTPSLIKSANGDPEEKNPSL